MYARHDISEWVKKKSTRCVHMLYENDCIQLFVLFVY